MKSVTSSLSHVNLKLLQTFLMVGEYSSFRIAAEKSFRSQSAVSAQIRQLEDQLGVPLFHRTTRSVRLTEEGQQLLDCAQRALMEVEQGLRKIRESADIRKGKVSMSCSPTIAETRLARALAAFESEYPGIEVSVRELASEQIFDSVRRREVDFGIGPQIDTSEFHFETLMDDPFYALAEALARHRQGHRPFGGAGRDAFAGAESGDRDAQHDRRDHERQAAALHAPL